MDPTSAFPSANSSSFSLAEIWPFHCQINGESTGVLGVRRGGYGQNLSGFEEIGASVDESTVTQQISGRSGGGNRKKRRQELASLSEDESKLDSTSSGNEMNDNDGKLPKVLESNVGSKTGGEESSGLGNKPPESTRPSEPPPKQDYIHVRARRGQATDSHSLAERARREKISERMKILQDLVPGCNKVIGKALVLDEIINYIQSLQRQVEFLSMKLEAVNSRVTPTNDGYPPRDASQSMTFDAGMAFVAQAASEFGQGSASEWLHMQVGGGFERAA